MKDLDNWKLKTEDIQMELLLFLDCFTSMNKLFQKNLSLAGNKDYLSKMVSVFHLKLSELLVRGI